MNIKYKESVIVFGIVIPLVFLAILFAFVFLKTKSIKKEYELKKNKMETATRIKKQNLILKETVDTQKQRLESWQTLFTENDRADFLEHWKQVEKQFKKNEFEYDRPIWKLEGAGIAAGAKQPASQVSMGFNATYRAMQIALLEIETKMPQIQLNSMNMKPNVDGKTMHFTTNFTIWTKE